MKKTLALLPLILLLMSSCERRQQIIAEGEFANETDSAIYRYKEYIFRDTFYREVSFKGVLVTKTMSILQQAYVDSTFSETDFYPNGNQKATRNFIAGKQQGVWGSWYEDGKIKSKSVVDAGLLRDYLSYYENGSIAVTASRAADGKMSRTDRWRNGNLKEEFITDSLGNGNCTNYYPNGRKQQEGALFRFTPSGNWHRWDSLGKPIADTSYGKPITF
jgi:antitoxin component YwqK of YwqJK toxin-antitoxin module